MSVPENVDNEPEVRTRIVQVLEVTGMLRDNGQKGLFLQLGHSGEVEPPLFIPLWDARRLVGEAVAVLATIDAGHPIVAKLAEAMYSFESSSGPAWAERGDPSVGPWPKPPKKPRRKKK